MKQKLLIFSSALAVIALLIALNAASYVQKEQEADNEMRPNRSTYNTGATGTRAFYDLLAETGRPVTRWQQPMAKLADDAQNPPAVFVIIGRTRREITEEDARQILDWTARGGTLVLIDREPAKDLVTTTAGWRLSLAYPSESLTFEIDPADPNQMTAKTTAAKPAQPSVFTAKINGVQPSRFAATVNFERYANADIDLPDSDEPPKAVESDAGSGEDPDPKLGDGQNEFRLLQQQQPAPSSPPDVVTESRAGEAEEKEEPAASLSQTAPVVHLSNGQKNILVDAAFGAGRIVFLADPFIVSNGGISLVDNAQVGINTVASNGGLIAFDEYHQGFGANDNRLFQYFAGTPVFPLVAQIALLVGLIFFSQSRRFARPLPAAGPDRLSKLEYVAAMAELQQRTRGYDLAVENIYTDFRRRVARLLGVDNRSSSRKELARRLAERLNRDEKAIYDLMRKCEDIMHGEPTNKRAVLHLTGELRAIEEALGLRRSGRKI